MLNEKKEVKKEGREREGEKEEKEEGRGRGKEGEERVYNWSVSSLK